VPGRTLTACPKQTARITLCPAKNYTGRTLSAGGDSYDFAREKLTGKIDFINFFIPLTAPGPVRSSFGTASVVFYKNFS
jgi:hypothetical protein